MLYSELYELGGKVIIGVGNKHLLISGEHSLSPQNKSLSQYLEVLSPEAKEDLSTKSSESEDSRE